MKKIFTIILFLFSLTGFGQQFGQYNQTILDPYSVNPAAAGISNDIEINTVFKKNWTGFENAPLSYYIAGHSFVGKKPPKSYKPMSLRISDPKEWDKISNPQPKKYRHAVGGQFAYDQFGPYDRTSVEASYAFRYKLGDELQHNLSAGLSAGWTSARYDQSNIQTLEPDDPTRDKFLSANQNNAFFHFNAGIWYYSEKIMAGYSVRQFAQNEIWTGGQRSTAPLYTHHYLSFYYKKEMGNENFVLCPGVLVKYFKNNPVTIDAFAKLVYQEKFWGGVIYRHNNATALFFGTQYQKYRIGYSFDYNINPLMNYNSGSHEILLGITI
jgi:type IX secretion system PorP/SprF family membrane protein